MTFDPDITALERRYTQLERRVARLERADGGSEFQPSSTRRSAVSSMNAQDPYTRDSRDTTSGDTPLPTSNIRYRRRRYTKDGFVEELQVQKDTWRDGHSSISSFTSRRTITTIADRPDRPDRQSRDRRQAGQIDRYHLKETSYRSRPSDRNESYNNTRSYYKDSPVYQPDYHQDRRESRQQPQRAGPQPLQIAAGPTKRVRFIN